MRSLHEGFGGSLFDGQTICETFLEGGERHLTQFDLLPAGEKTNERPHPDKEPYHGFRFSLSLELVSSMMFVVLCICMCTVCMCVHYVTKGDGLLSSSPCAVRPRVRFNPLAQAPIQKRGDFVVLY